MSTKTGIQWTDATWNPVRGCSRVSEGCRNCYAERTAARFAQPGSIEGGRFVGFVTKVNGHPSWTGKVELIESKLTEPLRWRQPKRIFVNSMSDLFHEALPFEAIDEVFTAMVAAPQHTYQILTKRPVRMREYFESGRSDRGCGPDRAGYHLDQKIWLGVSVEDPKTADERIPLLLQTPAAIRFVSYEPALGLVDFSRYLQPHWTPRDGADRPPWLDWLIVGGESGPGARPFDIAWARSAVRQCRDAGVACFVKQLGVKSVHSELDLAAWPNGAQGQPGAWRPILHDRKGGDPAEWPEDLRVREFPEVRAHSGAAT